MDLFLAQMHSHLCTYKFHLDIQNASQTENGESIITLLISNLLAQIYLCNQWYTKGEVVGTAFPTYSALSANHFNTLTCLLPNTSLTEVPVFKGNRPIKNKYENHKKQKFSFKIEV